MKLDQLLKTVSNTAQINNINQPFMVGGVPRDRIIGTIGKVDKIKDIDLTTGDDGSIKLARLLHRKLQGSNFREYDDGHASLEFMGINFDFSNNFIAPGVHRELVRLGIKDINNMKIEVYSRDFTINTMLESLDFKDIYDLTGQAINDIKSKIIRCPIDPNISIGVDSRRILRAIRFSIKYNFSIENNLKLAMREHRKKISDLPTQYVQNKMLEIVRLDDERGVDMLIEYKLLPLVPLTKTLSDILIQKRKILKAI